MRFLIRPKRRPLVRTLRPVLEELRSRIAPSVSMLEDFAPPDAEVAICIVDESSLVDDSAVSDDGLTQDGEVIDQIFSDEESDPTLTDGTTEETGDWMLAFFSVGVIEEGPVEEGPVEAGVDAFVEEAVGEEVLGEEGGFDDGPVDPRILYFTVGETVEDGTVLDDGETVEIGDVGDPVEYAVDPLPEDGDGGEIRTVGGEGEDLLLPPTMDANGGEKVESVQEEVVHVRYFDANVASESDAGASEATEDEAMGPFLPAVEPEVILLTGETENVDASVGVAESLEASFELDVPAPSFGDPTQDDVDVPSVETPSQSKPDEVVTVVPTTPVSTEPAGTSISELANLGGISGSTDAAPRLQVL